MIIKPVVPGKKRIAESESGAALIIAMLSIVLMTIIGLVLLDVLQNGFINSASAEAEIQADILAQNGLDEALTRIKSSVDKGNDTGTSYLDKITKVINGVTSQPTNFVGGGHNRGTFSVVTTNEVVKNPNTPADSQNAYLHKVVVTSTGTTNSISPQRSVTKKMTVYVSTINPVFRYPLSSNEDLTLNGTPYIIGDVVSKQLVKVSKYAQYRNPINLENQTTGYPSIKGFIHAKNGYSKDSGVTVSTTPGSDMFDSTSEGFTAYHDDQLTANWEDIDVPAIVSGKLSQLSSSTFRTPVEESQNTVYDLDGYPLGINEKKYLDKWVKNSGGPLTLKGNLVIENGAFNTDSTSKITVNKLLTTDGKDQGSMYIKYTDRDLVAANLAGELSFDKGEYLAVEGNVVINDGFKFDGTMYVNGNLKIIGSVNLNGVIYVDGEVEMKEMRTINGTSNAPVIIASSGKFVLSDNARSDDAINNYNSVRAFLYSEDNLELFGVKSRMKIQGGIHGKNVTLNAMRGDIIDLTNLTFENQQAGHTGLEDKSRLKMFYDNALYTLYTPANIPVTDDVNVFVKEIVHN